VRGGAAKWTLKHLPDGTSSEFTDEVVPLAIELAGSLPPWTKLTGLTLGFAFAGTASSSETREIGPLSSEGPDGGCPPVSESISNNEYRVLSSEYVPLPFLMALSP
jgi:hypothetical protein